MFLLSCNLLRFRNRLCTFSRHVCSFTNRFCSFLLFYQSLLQVSTRLPFTSRLYSFGSRSTHFYSFTQDSTSFIKLGLRSGFHQLKLSLAFPPITFQFFLKNATRLILGVFFPRGELQHAIRKIFPGIKRVANIADGILTTIRHKNSEASTLTPWVNVGCKFAWSSLATTARLGTTLSEWGGGILGIFEQL